MPSIQKIARPSTRMSLDVGSFSANADTLPALDLFSASTSNEGMPRAFCVKGVAESAGQENSTVEALYVCCNRCLATLATSSWPAASRMS